MTMDQDAASCLAGLDKLLAARQALSATEAEALRTEWETIRNLRMSIQRRVEEIERAHNAASQNASKISDEYERLALLRERAANAMARTPPQIPKAPRRAIRAIRDVPKLKQELLAASSEIHAESAVSGVYFLLHDGEVVYVGQSINILARLATHATEGAKVFNRWCFIEVERKKLTEIEAFYITLLRPRFNKHGKPALLAEIDPKVTPAPAGQE